MDKYCLFQYRKLYPKDYPLRRECDFPTKVSNKPLHLFLLKYFFLFYVIRCFGIVFIGPIVDTERKRIYLGAELFKADYIYMETTFLIWSSISYLYLQFSFTDCSLDYKFLAIFRMSDWNLDYLQPKHFGLTFDEFVKFKVSLICLDFHL